MTVRGGPGGYEAFIGDIRRIFGITAEHDMQLAFDCADPVTGALPDILADCYQGWVEVKGGEAVTLSTHPLTSHCSSSLTARTTSQIRSCSPCM